MLTFLTFEEALDITIPRSRMLLVTQIVARFPLYTCRVLPSVSSRSLHLSVATFRRDDRKTLLQTVLPKDEGVHGEWSVGSVDKKTGFAINIPTPETHSMLFDGVRYDQLPVAHIHTSKNNTIISVTDHIGSKFIAQGSCGTEGFKNAKKGTNIAAQATGINVGTRALKAGLTNVKVTIKGLGPGRTASVKGLQMSGLQVISITDDTPTGHCQRPRKQRKL